MHLILIWIPSFWASQAAGVCSVLIGDSVIPLKYLSGLNNIKSPAMELSKLETTADLRTSHSLLADVGFYPMTSGFIKTSPAETVIFILPLKVAVFKYC